MFNLILQNNFKTCVYMQNKIYLGHIQKKINVLSMNKNIKFEIQRGNFASLALKNVDDKKKDRQSLWKNCKRLKNSDSNEEVDINEPIKFSTSKAATWNSEQIYLSPHITSKIDTPWYEMYVIIGSVASVLIYFCILREENDIDEKLGKSLYDHVEALEEVQLEICLKHYRETGKDTTNVEKRLKEIQLLKVRKVT